MAARKEAVQNSSSLLEALTEIQEKNFSDGNKKEIVDIITFCEGSQYLNLPGNNFHLWMSQRVILKCFYMGTRGNEKLKLTQEEWAWLYGKEDDEERDGVKYEKNIDNVITKLKIKEKEQAQALAKGDTETYNSFNFTELNLVLGRRGSKCRSENDRISTTKGSLTYRELHDRVNNGEKIGICTYDQDAWKRKISYDIKLCENGIVDCYELETQRGMKETSSWNHPYLIWRDDEEKPKFVKLQDLRVGDRIAVADKTELFGEGSIGVNRATLLGHGKKAIDKDVPECIYKGSKEEVVAFLNALFGCYGYYATDKKTSTSHSNKKSIIGIELASKKFVQGIQHLLLKFGIHSSIIDKSVKYKDEEKDAWALVITRKEDIIRFQQEIDILSKEECVEDAVLAAQARDEAKSEFDSVPKGVWNYMESEAKNSKFLKDISTSDIRWDKVKSVEHVGNQRTIDMEVPETHVIGGDIISHNTIMASVITSYEVYKLLVIGDGDPHKFYGLPYDDVITIVNVALSQQQAGKLFGEIQNRLRGAPFFRGRIAKETASEIRLYTDKDLEKKEDGAIISVQGSISILCGHSNPDSLRGMSTILILFDEMAFLDETGKVNGKKFYETLRPSRLKFLKYGDGRLVEISSPNTESGMFYEIFKSSRTEHQILSFQLPTWDSNPDITYDDADLRQDRKRSLDSFSVEYGAQWSKGGNYGPYFEEGLVDRCICTDLEPHRSPQPGVNYYLHVDPANGGDRYAAVLVAKKPYKNSLGHRRIRVEMANSWVFTPVPGVGLVFNEIDRAVLHICKIFRPVLVTFDDFQSAHSLQFLRSNGVNCVKTNFSRGYKNKIYQNLKDMMSYHPNPELCIYEDQYGIVSELKGIRYRPTARGVSLSVDKNSDLPYDDLVDCLCGATAMASETTKMALPAPVVVSTGFI